MQNISVLPQYQRRTKWEPMPVVTASLSLPVLASVIWTFVVSVVIRQPDVSDSYAIAGAGLAAVCALIEARSKARSGWETISVFITASVIGTCGPAIGFGILKYWGWISEKLEQNMMWQWWAAAGFFCGVNGWFATHFINQKFRAWIDARFGSIGKTGMKRPPHQ